MNDVKGEVIMYVSPKTRWQKIFEICQKNGFKHCHVQCRTPLEGKNAYIRGWYYIRDTGTAMVISRRKENLYITFNDIEAHRGVLNMTITDKDTIHCSYDNKISSHFVKRRTV